MVHPKAPQATDQPSLQAAAQPQLDGRLRALLQSKVRAKPERLGAVLHLSNQQHYMNVVPAYSRLWGNPSNYDFGS